MVRMAVELFVKVCRMVAPQLMGEHFRKTLFHNALIFEEWLEFKTTCFNLAFNAMHGPGSTFRDELRSA